MEIIEAGALPNPARPGRIWKGTKLTSCSAAFKARNTEATAVGDVIEQCSECVALLGDYLDGSLPRERHDALERHLSMCMPCITFVRTYKKTSAIARETLAAQMPQELVASLQNFLKGAIPGFACDGKKGECGGSAHKPDPKKS